MKICITMLMFISFVFAVDVKTYIPDRADKYLHTVYTEGERIFPEFMLPPYFGSLIEHESCIRLTYKKCWNPESELKTFYDTGIRREHGVGLPQITRAWRSDGSLRFDTLYNLRVKHNKELKDFKWDKATEQADLQIRAMLLLWKENYDKLPSKMTVIDRIAFADSAYNGGFRYIIRDRERCGLKKDCDPDKWFGNVELINSRGDRILYGNRTANQINRHHVNDVLNTRLNKYIDDWIDRTYFPYDDN